MIEPTLSSSFEEKMHLLNGPVRQVIGPETLMEGPLMGTALLLMMM